MKLRPRLPAKVLKVAVFIAMLATNDDETNMAGLTLPFPANYDAEWGRTPVLRGSSRTRSYRLTRGAGERSSPRSLAFLWGRLAACGGFVGRLPRSSGWIFAGLGGIGFSLWRRA